MVSLSRFPCFIKRACTGLIILLASLSTGSAADTAQEKRSALVIGNARYEQEAGRLRNTDNDAKAVAQALRSLGFSVIEKHDVTRDQLIKATEEFRKTLQGVEVSFFYYAGHGISVAGENYLIPIKSGFNPDGADSIGLRMMAETRLFNVQQAVADMSAAGDACNLVVLDACRNTPLMRDTKTRGWTGKQGLSEMTPPAGTLIAFATDAGHTALDGAGTNGLYTQELLKHLSTPNLTIEQVFKRTRANVVKISEGTQVPAEYSRLMGDDVYLAGNQAPLIETHSPPEEEPEELPTVAPTPEALIKLAQEGQTEACLEGLKLLIRSRGAGIYAAPTLEAILETVKTSLKAPDPSTEILEEAARNCESVLRILPESLPLDQARSSAIAAKAYNRRGDAFLLLNRPEEAIDSFNTAFSLTPEDSYILYNRGRAHLALGQADEAKADFKSVDNAKFNQPKARKLAQEALTELGKQKEPPSIGVSTP